MLLGGAALQPTGGKAKYNNNNNTSPAPAFTFCFPCSTSRNCGVAFPRDLGQGRRHPSPRSPLPPHPHPRPPRGAGRPLGPPSRVPDVSQGCCIPKFDRGEEPRGRFGVSLLLSHLVREVSVLFSSPSSRFGFPGCSHPLPFSNVPNTPSLSLPKPFPPQGEAKAISGAQPRGKCRAEPNY